MLAPDLRGFGSTEAPGRGYDGETFARDQIALLDALGIEQVKLIGHDWGGWTAMMLGLDHPERIDRMIVIDAPHPWPRLRPSLIPELWRSCTPRRSSTPVLGPWLLRRTGFAKGILRRGTAPGTSWSTSDPSWSATERWDSSAASSSRAASASRASRSSRASRCPTSRGCLSRSCPWRRFRGRA